MNWQDWPEGENTGMMNDFCPVCSSELRPVEIHYIVPSTVYGEADEAYYTAICPKCRVKYLLCAPRNTVTIGPNEDRIIELENRVRALEETLSKLIEYIRNTRYSAPTPQIPEQKPVDDTEDFTRRYRHLL